MQTTTRPAPTEVLGQARAVMACKIVEYLGLTLFIAVVPRVMGPALYGQLALLLSFVGLLALVNNLGALPTFGRFVPEYEARDDRSAIRTLFTQIFLARAGVALLLGGVFALVFPLLLPAASPLVVAAGAGVVVVSGIAATCYDLFYGLNSLGRWLTREALVRPVFFTLMLVSGGLNSLDRAGLALLAAHLGFLVIGLAWTRKFFAVGPGVAAGPGLLPHVFFGLGFFAANLPLLGVWRAGEALIQLLSGASDEVAFFSLANAIGFALAMLLGQLGAVLGPSLAALHVTGRNREVELLLGHSLKYVTIGAFLILFGVEATGDWVVVRVLGESYLPVSGNLLILALGLFPIGLIRTGTSLAVLHKSARSLVPVTGSASIVFLAASFLLIPTMAGRGAAIAVALALWTAGTASALLFPLGRAISLACPGRLVLCGLPVLAVLAWPTGAALDACAILLYVPALFASGAITPREVRIIGGALIKGRR